jgi:hypothetical protein
MASRWMQAKLAIMAKQRKFEPRDTIHRAGHSLAASEARSAEISELVQGFSGVVTVVESGKPPVAVGKNRRSYSREVGARGGVVRQLDLHEWSETAAWELVRR